MKALREALFAIMFIAVVCALVSHPARAGTQTQADAVVVAAMIAPQTITILDDKPIMATSCFEVFSSSSHVLALAPSYKIVAGSTRLIEPFASSPSFVRRE